MVDIVYQIPLFVVVRSVNYYPLYALQLFGFTLWWSWILTDWYIHRRMDLGNIVVVHALRVATQWYIPQAILSVALASEDDFILLDHCKVFVGEYHRAPVVAERTHCYQ